MAFMDNIKHRLLEMWFKVKEYKHNTSPDKIPIVKNGEIWWTAIGENVGIEINGKGDKFSRPVIIFKRLSHFGFIGIPITSQEHQGSWYMKFRFQGRDEYAVFSQIRTFSSARLYNRLGQLAEDDFQLIKQKLKEFMF